MKNMEHKVLMLRPMRPGLSGFVSLRRERNRYLYTIRAKGLQSAGFRAFLLTGEPVELGSAAASRGEGCLQGDVSASILEGGNIRAVALIENRQNPGPLLLGLLSAPETMTAARSACLELCQGFRCRTGGNKEKDSVEKAEKGNQLDGDRQDGLPKQLESGEKQTLAVEEDALHGGSRERAEHSGDGAAFSGNEAKLGQNVAAVREALLSPSCNISSKRPKPRPLPMEEIKRLMAAAGNMFREMERKSARNSGKAIAEPPEKPLREAFFTAIDPLPYVTAAEDTSKPSSEKAPEEKPNHQETGPEVEPCRAALCTDKTSPVDALPELIWPPLLQPLAEAFLRYPPSGRFALPGWRFVCASRQGDGLWIGRYVEDGRVTRAAYVMRGAPAGNNLGKTGTSAGDGSVHRPEEREYQPLRGTDGVLYRALVLRA